MNRRSTGVHIESPECLIRYALFSRLHACFIPSTLLDLDYHLPSCSCARTVSPLHEPLHFHSLVRRVCWVHPLVRFGLEMGYPVWHETTGVSLINNRKQPTQSLQPSPELPRRMEEDRYWEDLWWLLFGCYKREVRKLLALSTAAPDSRKSELRFLSLSDRRPEYLDWFTNGTHCSYCEDWSKICWILLWLARLISKLRAHAWRW